MRISDLHPELSDQLYIWSDTHAPQLAQTDFCCLAPTPSPAIAPAATARPRAPWFSHRALQALREAGMQVRPRPRSWPEVLPLGQSLRATTANGLDPPGLLPPDHRVCNQLPSPPSDGGRDLRDQSRAVVPSRGTLRNLHESRTCLNLGFRRQTWQPAACEHALRLARRRISWPSNSGGRA